MNQMAMSAIIEMDQPIFDVTGLLKQQPGQVPKMAFAHMINFNDTNTERSRLRNNTLKKKDPKEIAKVLRR
jgi:hypothetical protein